MTFLKPILFSSLVLLLFISCNDDDLIKRETATFNVLIENVVSPTTFFQGGVVNVPIDETTSGALFPGGKYEIEFNAAAHILPNDAGAKLSFVTMFVQSNDLFLAPNEEGIALFNEDGSAIGEGSTIDVTNQVLLWDAGSEVNEITGGPNQKPQQDVTSGSENAEDIGEAENGVVTKILNNTDGKNTLPEVADVIKVIVDYQGDNIFKVVFENVSDETTIAIPYNGTTNNETTRGPVPLSPFAWVIHTNKAPFFTTGETATEALESIAEDGATLIAGQDISTNLGVIIPLSPGVFAVHNSTTNPFFNLNAVDFGEGLTRIAEDGDPVMLAESLTTKTGVFASGVFNTPVGASNPGAIGPGESYNFTFDAKAGDRFSLATMFVQSNDWFYSFAENGIPLFAANEPIVGDRTELIFLFDAGSEEDQYPGSGSNQVIRQTTSNTGTEDSNNIVREVSNLPSIVPAQPSSIIRVSLSVN